MPNKSSSCPKTGTISGIRSIGDTVYAAEANHAPTVVNNSAEFLLFFMLPPPTNHYYAHHGHMCQYSRKSCRNEPVDGFWGHCAP